MLSTIYFGWKINVTLFRLVMLLVSLMMVVSCRGYLEDQIRLREFAPKLPTFKSLWETNKHYVEAKKDIQLGGVNKLKNNISIIENPFEELDGYVYFQFVYNSQKDQSYLTLGVSTEVCHLDGEGKFSYKLTLIENVERHYDTFAESCEDYCVVLLKMYTDSHCSEEFGKYLLPSLDNAEQQEGHGNLTQHRLLITTSTSKDSLKLPVPVVGTFLSVMPQDNEKLQYTVPPYIFAVGNNADIFNKIPAKAGNLLSLTMQCTAKSFISVSIGITTYGDDKPTVCNVSTTILNQFVHPTTLLRLNNKNANDEDSDNYYPELSTADLFVSLFEHVQDPTTGTEQNIAAKNSEMMESAGHDPTIGTKQNNEAKSGEMLKSGNLRGSQHRVYDTTEDEDVFTFDDNCDDDNDNYDKNMGDDTSDKNIGGANSDNNISDVTVADTVADNNIADSTADSIIHGNDHEGDYDMFAYKDDDSNHIKTIKRWEKHTTMKWVVTIHCVGEE